MGKAKRTRGFETPFSLDQIITWIINPLLYSSFISFSVIFLTDTTKKISILIPYIVMIFIVIYNYYLCETIDPEDSKEKIRRYTLPIPFKSTRYCTVCKKSSPGLDHHCTWLNTCIAQNNYAPFFVLVWTCTIQLFYQSIIGILITTIWWVETDSEFDTSYYLTYQIFIWIHNVVSGSLAFTLLSLAGFHVYLLYLKLGTYDWLLEVGKKSSTSSKEKMCKLPRFCFCFNAFLVHKKKNKQAKIKKELKSYPSTMPELQKVESKDVQIDTLNELKLNKKLEQDKWKKEWIEKQSWMDPVLTVPSEIINNHSSEDKSIRSQNDDVTKESKITIEITKE